MNIADFSSLDAAGLNLHAVLALDELPAGVRERLDPAHAYAQLLLVGNGGRALWTAIEAEGIASADPIDDHSVRCVERWLRDNAPACRFGIVYPGGAAIDLQALGTIAGWHQPSPLMLGINARWGTWFAYRVAVLTDTDFVPTCATTEASPCQACAARPCAAACPGHAVDAGDTGESGAGGYAVERCVAYRLTPGSACRATCVARLACPVARDARYSDAQLRHSYSISLRMIERHYPPMST